MRGPGPTLLALAALPGWLAGQGATTAALQGSVSDENGDAISGATVRLVNGANGARWVVTTGPDGDFLLEAVTVGTYDVEVRAFAFEPESRAGLTLMLGQRAELDVVLGLEPVPLAPLTVTVTRDAALDPGRTGPAEIITRATIERLPNPGRSFVGLTLLSPQVRASPNTAAVPTGGISIGGPNRLYNSFQIDGGVHEDLYRGQLPGRQSLPRPLSLDALEEIQVLPAPFDVRHAGFAGGLVNAVTRSGTNTTHGSLFAFLSDASLGRRPGIGDIEVGDFTTWQVGGTLGGPIVRDRIHYFISADVQHRVVTDPGPLIGEMVGADTARIGISLASALRLQTVLDTLYGLDAGGLGPVHGRIPAQDLFAKVSVQLATNSHLDLSHHYAHGTRRDFLLRTQGYYALSSRGEAEVTTSHASRAIWRSVLGGRWSNELVASHLILQDDCRPRQAYPQIRVFVGPTNMLDVGNAATCPSSGQRQHALEVTNSLTAGLGRHAVTVGVHGELLRFRDELLQGSPGLWVFSDSGLDSLELRRPRTYQRTLPGASWNGALVFDAATVALYAQDRWSPTRRLTLTLGLRVDLPLPRDDVLTNPLVRDSLGFDTGSRPGEGLLWSPRLGFNYDVDGSGRTYLRGGVGLFGGAPPYRWIGNAYRDDGTRELLLVCGQAVAPRADNVDFLDQPSTCQDGAGPTPQESFFDAGLKSPQDLKVALGVDRRLPGGLVGTVDVLYSRGLSNLYLTDVNLRGVTRLSYGEGGRPLYGTMSPGGVGRSARIAPSLGRVIRVSNRGGDQAWSVGAQLRGSLGRAVHARALYSFSRARDRMWLAHFPARALLEGTVLDGTHEDRDLAPSFHDVPHRVQVVVDVRLPLGLDLGLSYSGASGRPFTYVVAGGDANADELGGALVQDAAYVPTSRGDISMDGNGRLPGVGTAAEQDAAYAALDDFIRSVDCLREQRGQVVGRNSCRNPWFGVLNARLTKAFPVADGQSLEVSADVYNVLNLIHSGWGLSRYHGLTFGTGLVVLRGYDAMRGRGIYEFDRTDPPPRDQVEDLASRWQIEIGVRYRR